VVVSTVEKAIDIAKFLKQKVNPTREGCKALALGLNPKQQALTMD
jgi:hypothetical protein